MDRSAQITYPEGASIFNPTDEKPAKLGLASLTHVTDNGTNPYAPDKDKNQVWAVYEPGNVRVVFQNGTDKFNLEDKESLAGKLNEVGELIARLVNIQRVIVLTEQLLKVANELRGRLMGTTGLPDNLPTTPMERLGLWSNHEAASLGHYDTNRKSDLKEVLLQEKAAIIKRLKECGVIGADYKDAIPNCNRFIEWFELLRLNKPPG